MEYHSPIILMKELGIDSNDINIDNLANLQKRLLLEIDLTDHGFLNTSELQVSKDDVLKLFTDLRNDHHLNFHFLIYQNKALLDFLTQGKIDPEIKSAMSELVSHDGFIDFISPFLSFKIKRKLKSTFLKREFEQSELLSSLTIYLSYFYQSSAYDLFAGELTSLIREIVSLYHGEIGFNDKHHGFLLDTSFIRFINLLPDEFDQKRNHLASALNDLGTVIHEKKLDTAIALYNQLQYMRCRLELEKIIINNLSYVKSIRNKNFTYTIMSVIGFALIFFLVFKFVDIVYLTSDEEKFNQKQSEYLKGHLLFTDEIKAITSNIEQIKIDSSSLTKVPDYPYFIYYSTLIKPSDNHEVKMKFGNNSANDLVVFSIRKQGTYSFSLQSGSKKTAYLSINDVFNIYAGNSWFANMKYPQRVSGDPNKSLLGLNNGFFVDNSPATIELFDQFYKIGNTTVSQFNLEEFYTESYSLNLQLIDSVVSYNSSIYQNPSDSIVMDSIAIDIMNAGIDSMIQITPYYHFLK